MRGYVSVLVLATALFGGCAPQGPVRAALRDDLATLRAEIAKARSAGQLDRAQVSDLAKAVAEREIVSATGPDAESSVHAFSGCARSLSSALRKRSERHDAGGAAALKLLFLQRELGADELYRRYARDPEPSFRALAASASTAARARAQRRAWFIDADERVRRGAFESALSAPDASDLGALLEAFRLEPDPTARALAARAAGAIGGEAAVLGLKDRFERADEQGRLAVVEAWANQPSFAAGGARELELVANDKQGLVSLAAVDALRRHGDTNPAWVGLLVSAMRDGSEDEQRLAMRLAPLTDARVMSELRRATGNANSAIRVLAWSRLLDAAKGASPAVKPAKPAADDPANALFALATSKDSQAFEALTILAAAGDVRVVPGLEARAQKGDAEQRATAAVALFRLGKTAESAPALADADPTVRARTACGIVANSN